MDKKAKKRIVLFAVAAVAAAVLIFFGIYRGEVSVIFQNAATVCLECIGLGK